MTSEQLPPGPPPPPLGSAGSQIAREPERGRKTWLIVTIAVVIALVIGGGITIGLVANHRADVAAQERRDKAAEERAQAEKEAAAEAAKEAEEAERQQQEQAAAAELAALQKAYDGCRSEINPFFDAMRDVDARLDVGLSQSDLSDLVGAASVAYNRMNVDALGGGACLDAAVKLETAFNGYAGTVNQWNDCIFEDDYCTLDDIESDLQTKWLKASTAIDRAADMLLNMDPASGG